MIVNGAEGRGFELLFGQLVTGKLSLVNLAVKGYHFSNQLMIKSKERDGLRLSNVVLKIQWVSNPDCPVWPLGAIGNPYFLYYFILGYLEG